MQPSYVETDEPLVYTASTERVRKDQGGVLHASAFTADVCGCCGKMKLLLTDQDNVAFAWISVTPHQARDFAAHLLILAERSEALSGLRAAHKH